MLNDGEEAVITSKVFDAFTKRDSYLRKEYDIAKTNGDLPLYEMIEGARSEIDFIELKLELDMVRWKCREHSILMSDEHRTAYLSNAQSNKT